MPAPLMHMPLAFFGIPGGYEVIVVGFVALLIFGNRLPGVMKSLGKSVTEFKKGVAGIEDDIDSAVTADKKPAPTTTTATTASPTPEATVRD
jgi:sec-independent protein translocase protein TatA